MKIRKKILATVLAIILATSYTAEALAIDYTLDKMLNDIVFSGDTLNACSPTAVGKKSTVSEGATGSNQDYKGDPVWTDEELELIQQHQATYIEAAEEYDVPWAMLAVIHKRENSLFLTYNSNQQGIYQFYEMAGQFPGSGTASQEQFLRETRMLAEQLQNDYVKRNHSSNAGPLSANTEDNVIQDTFFSYNGRADVYAAQARSLGFSGDGEAFNGSPYVMNKADAERDPNENPSGWGQVKTDGGGIVYPANQDYGAWVYYAAIAGVSGCASSGDTFIMNIEGMDYAWPVAPARRSEHENVPGMTPLPCTTRRGCHHDQTPAFDISRLPGGSAVAGTPIYAITDGMITNTNPALKGVPGCNSIQFVSDDGTENPFQYWYGHIQEVAGPDGTEVSVGDQVAVMGEINCTKNNTGGPNSVEHLHIDRGSPKGASGGSVGSRDVGLVEIINTLYENLPE